MGLKLNQIINIYNVGGAEGLKLWKYNLMVAGSSPAANILDMLVQNF